MNEGRQRVRFAGGAEVGGSNPPVGPRESAADFDAVKGHVDACGRVC